MLSMDKFLLRHSLEGTATNAGGEAVYLGKAVTVKHLKYGFDVLWNIPENKGHISVLDKIILHDREKLFGVLNMPAFRIDQATKLQVRVK
jgi:hypothetical protein